MTEPKGDSVVLGVTDYTDPNTIDTDTVIGEITSAWRIRGKSWTDARSWPNVTVLALANEVVELRNAIAEHRGQKRTDRSCYPDDRADRLLWNRIPGAIHARFDADHWQGPKDRSSGATA